MCVLHIQCHPSLEIYVDFFGHASTFSCPPLGLLCPLVEASLDPAVRRGFLQLKYHVPLGFAKLPDSKILKAHCSIISAVEEFFCNPSSCRQPRMNK